MYILEIFLCKSFINIQGYVILSLLIKIIPSHALQSKLPQSKLTSHKLQVLLALTVKMLTGWLCVLSHVQLFVTQKTCPARLLCPCNFPGKGTGVDCHFPLQGIFTASDSWLFHLYSASSDCKSTHVNMLCSQRLSVGKIFCTFVSEVDVFQ